jgi:DNA recombination-mediator protein A
LLDDASIAPVRDFAAKAGYWPGARKARVTLVALGEPDYPSRLQMIDDAPPLIAIRGHIPALASPMVAIVGSRNASGAGMKFTQRIARELGDAGFAVVSGLASTPSCRPASRSPKSRSAGSRERATSRAAIG